MKSKKPLLVIGGLSGVISYCLLTFIATFFFNDTWTPLKYYLSDLGNSTLNPKGAFIFNFAPMILGGFLFLFYIGLNQWSKNIPTDLNTKHLKISQLVGIIFSFFLIYLGVYIEKLLFIGVLLCILFLIGICMKSKELSIKWNKFAIILTQIIGCISAFTLILVGMYSTDIPDLHIYWSSFFFNFHFTTFFILILILFPQKQFNKIIGIVGWIATNMILIWLLWFLPLNESLAVFSSFIFAILLSYNTFKMVNSK